MLEINTISNSSNLEKKKTVTVTNTYTHTYIHIYIRTFMLRQTFQREAPPKRVPP